MTDLYSAAARGQLRSTKEEPANRAFSVVIPCLCIASVNAYRLWTEHWEHVAHGPSLEEKTEYPFQNIRTKNFFWGDGDKVS